ncbi:ATP-binding cassette domain-containing protein [Ferrovibrio sp.]|jgi:putative ABC transport system ATP-binding protein|uniref:ABC transporter ATP-binding protein n=1 Tax=Ferrovibrio sp. TaxID=1917215 RepID=UPI00311DF531
MLALTGLGKRFFPGTPNERVALDGVSLDLKAGSFCVVIGSNGAGKSTLLNAVAGKFPVDAGSIAIDGQDVTRDPAWRRARLVSRVFQDPMTGTAAGMTVAENLLLAELRARPHRLRWGLTAARRAAWRDQLAILGLGLEDRLDDTIDTLSGGQRQAVSLVMAVTGEPKLLLLDEHTAALDPLTAERVMSATIRVIAERKLTALMVTHNMQHAVDHGDTLLMMDAGRILLLMQGTEKSGIGIADLVARFRDKEDRILLAS